MAEWPLQKAAQYTASTLSGASAYGVNVTTGAANTKGSTWTELHPALPFECHGIYTVIPGMNTADQYAIDFGIGASTAEQTLIPNWCVAAVRFSAQAMFWPIHIGKGVRVSARAQAGNATLTLQVHALFMSAGWGGMPGYTFCEVYNFASSTTGSTNTFDPGGSANTKPAYITLGTTTRDIRALNVMIDIRNSAASTFNWRWDLAVGATPDIIIPDFPLLSETTSDELGQRSFGPFPVFIPAGTAIKFRAQCSGTDATDRLLRNIHVYGMG